MKNTTLYLYGYIIGTIGLFLWATYDSLVHCTEYFTVMIDLTVGYKLGIFLNFVFLTFVTINYSIVRLLFGELRIIETEHLIENVPLLLLSNFFSLSMGSTTNDVSTNCLLLGITILVKVVKILSVDRYDFVQMKLINEISTDASLSRSAIIGKYLKCFYFWMLPITIAIHLTLAKFFIYDIFRGLNSIFCLILGFQFCVQGIEVITFFCKVLLGMYEAVQYREIETDDIDDLDGNDILNEANVEFVWENKVYYIKVVEILSSILVAVVHFVIIYFLCVTMELSLFLSTFAGIYHSLAKVYKEIKQLFQFIESSKKLDSSLPNASESDLANGDNLCSICRDVMHAETSSMPVNSRKRPKKLFCGHMIHISCLKEWLERSEDCPLCRRKVFLSQEDQQREAFRVEREELQQVVNNGLQETRTAQTDNRNEGTALNNDVSNTAEVNQHSMDLQQGSTTDIREGVSIDETNDEASLNFILPDSAILPPGWHVIPLKKKRDSYYAMYSTHDTGMVNVVPTSEGNELGLYKKVSLDAEQAIGSSNQLSESVLNELRSSNNEIKLRMNEMQEKIDQLKELEKKIDSTK